MATGVAGIIAPSFAARRGTAGSERHLLALERHATRTIKPIDDHGPACRRTTVPGGEGWSGVPQRSDASRQDRRMTTAPPFTRRGFFMPGRKYRCADHDAAGTGDWATGMRPGLPGNPKGDWHERRHRDTDNRFRRRRCHPIPLDMRPSHCRAHLRALRSLQSTRRSTAS